MKIISPPNHQNTKGNTNNFSGIRNVISIFSQLTTHNLQLFFGALVFSWLLFFSSCKKEELIFPIEPAITLVSATPTTVQQFNESIEIFIDYEDGDGDLGFEEADSNALSIHDSRLDNPDYYYVPPQAPLDAVIAISGTLHVTIPNVFLLGNGANETTIFTIKIKDRAGHWSNEIVTPAITITQ